MGSFGWEAIRAQRQGIGDLDSLAREAACCYLNDMDSGRPGWRYPRFRATEPATDSFELALTVGYPLQLAFAREAERQGTTSERLLQHALLYYLADLHAGRVAQRIADDLD
jgi:hypothetical protein